MKARRMLCGAMMGTVLVAISSMALSSEWPTRSVQTISPFTAGNANDIVARIVLDQVSRSVG